MKTGKIKRTYSYYVVTIFEEKENWNEWWDKNKYYAYAERVDNCNNLKDYFSRDNIHTVNAFPTFKEAKETADFWNECYKKNGSYLYSKT